MSTATSSCPSASTPEGPAPAWAARRLEVADVRCWRRAELELPAGLVLVVGPNGAGKTSLVEAVTLGCLGVSPRTAREAEVVRRGAEALHVAVDLDGPRGLHRREIGFAAGRGRRLRLDGEPVRALAAWRERAVLVFLPDELRAVKGPPAARRRALDRTLEAAAPGFAEDAAAYQEALAQRNALLRRVRAGAASEASLPAWEAPMAARGARVAAARRAGVAALAEPFADWLAALGGGRDGVLGLEPSPAALAEVPDDALEGVLAAALRDRRPRDVQAGQTLSGPHRDDLVIGAGPADLRRSGSQGEQRTAALALLLAARDHLRERAARPILLLDDVLSELDPGRRRLLLEAVRDGGQTLVTTADPAAADALSHPPDALVRVEDGALR
ncbi:MAG TPA: DNA replication and repair protein RecF [Miltoncostaeaceae bacterium]|jgi:DNA replication and repair protein RecF|nr:DNA replication and repair protein RecF [Miltoncostaeaceae bacterium]